MVTKKPPKHLKADGARLWRDLVAEYQLDDAAGLALLTTAAECLDRMREAQRVIEALGSVVEDFRGQPKANPACALEKDARNGFLAAIRALNLDIEPLQQRVGRPSSPTSWTGDNAH